MTASVFGRSLALTAGRFHVSLATFISPLPEGSFELGLIDGPGGARPFVSGPENALLLRAVEDFCSPADCPYNPLVLYGPSGIGKSHLAQGIRLRFEHGQEIGLPGAGHLEEGGDESTTVYLTGSEFAGDYAAAVDAHNVLAWREKIRAAKLLVLDGLWQLRDKPAAQIEFLHAVDELLAHDARVLVTALDAPGRLPRLLPALVGRLSAGLCVPVARPGIEARLSLLPRLASERGLSLSGDAQRLLAEKLPLNVPELSGALCELAARCRATGQLIDRTSVREFLQSVRGGSRTTVGQVAARSARHFAVKVADMRGPSRRQSLVTARGIAMYLSRQLTEMSFSAIGQYFGRRDHTTVLHACRKTEELMRSTIEIRQALAEIRRDLCEGQIPVSTE